MDGGRWQEIRARFEELVELGADARAQRLAAIGAADPELRDALALLLAADARSSDNLGAPARARSAERPDPLGLAGSTISHFRILEPLGVGGMGVVYRAEDTRLRRLVALKLPLPHLQLDPAAKERFLREARSAAALDHPNLCTIHEVGDSEEGRLFLAMPLYAGETLRARLDRERMLPIGEAVAIARQVALGLACAHAAGIVHRDLKPTNLMVLPDGTVKILDFGLAKAREPGLTATGLTPGTVAYMAPEQVRGDPVDARADLWALGIVLYEMLTGRRPFAGATEIAVAHTILEDVPARPTVPRAEIPAALEDEVLGLLAKDPGERPSNATEIAAALGAIGGAQAPSPTLPLRRAGRLRPRRGGLAWTAASIAGILTVGAAAWGALILRRHRRPQLDPHRVLVAVFENETGDPAFKPLGHFAADYITQGVAGSDFATPIDARGMAGVWRDSASDPKVVRRLALEYGAGTLVLGRYYLVGDSIRFDAEVTDARDGHMLRDLEPVATPRSSLEPGVEHLRDQVLGALAGHLAPWLTSWETRSKDRLPTYAAYRAYSAGLDAYTIYTDWKAAAAAFDRAAALDTTFLAARIWAALSQYLVAMDVPDSSRTEQARQVALADSVATGIEARRERLSTYDRYFFDYYLAFRRANTEAAYEAATRMVQSAPGSVNALRELMFSAARTGRPREALQLSTRLNPESHPAPELGIFWLYFVWCPHQLGDYGLELEHARIAQRLYPREAEYATGELRALVGLGRVTEAEGRLEQRADNLDGRAIYRIALDMRAHGHAAASRRTLLRALAWARTHSPQDAAPQAGVDALGAVVGAGFRNQQADARLLEADVLFALGRESEARPLYERVARADSSSFWAPARLGVIAAHAGDLATARRLYAGLLARTSHLPQRDIDLTLGRAIVAAALGDRDAAVLYAGQAYDNGWFARHWLPDFDSLRRYPPFEAQLRPKD